MFANQESNKVLIFRLFKELTEEKNLLGKWGNFLAVQWLGLCTFRAKSPGSVPDQE